ncbi:MAG: zf-HC2 domain-containing protein [Planctomycetota bacterium]
MRCHKARKWLSASFDGELDVAREQAVKAHVNRCSACRQFAADLPGGARDLELLTVPEPRAGFTGRCLARLLEPGTPRTWSRAWFEILRPVQVAAAVVALSCGAFLALSMNGASSSPVSTGEEPAERLYAECFDAAPGDSAGARYLALLQEAEK